MNFTTMLFLAFGISALIELYFFLLQRVPLEVLREHGLPVEFRFFMLPRWYLFAWLPRIAKYVSFALIFWYVGWWQVALCILSTLIVFSVAPVPYTYVSNIMERQLISEYDGPNRDAAEQLLLALEQSRSRHGF